jgi:hypothetical protein
LVGVVAEGVPLGFQLGQHFSGFVATLVGVWAFKGAVLDARGAGAVGDILMEILGVEGAYVVGQSH